ncbi:MULTISPECIES: TetR/AcrR family transcriptional regulator [Thermomonosporaceae]|uniref:TetR/AcrR family transcriptional regulator n=1 Tax=Thermomonosporaceae TaxID=2012 RepID=UPI00255B1604|nr:MULTISPECIES: TetR/AcrR family transcriptional regulator [Thermomonosporaceae]MDL4776467.1 TetR/AcrR family transcriptional regulator [Actinomadura xylanilytica]
MTVETGLGLRERKKAATREALSRAALRLAIRHGAAGVTVEGIAAEAGVSPRTFHNYFAGKEEAIVSPLTDGARDLIDALRARPAAEPVWTSLRAVLGAGLPSGPREETLALLRVIKDEPALLARQLGGLGEIQRQIAEVIADRTGTDAGRDLYPHLLAGVVAVTLRVVAEARVNGGTGADLPELIDSAFAQLRAGLPPPDPRPA